MIRTGVMLGVILIALLFSAQACFPKAFAQSIASESLQVTTTLPETVAAGELVTFEVIVSNSSAMTQTLNAEVQIRIAILDPSEGQFIPSPGTDLPKIQCFPTVCSRTWVGEIPPGESATLTIRLKFDEKLGRYDFLQVELLGSDVAIERSIEVIPAEEDIEDFSQLYLPQVMDD